MTGCNICANNYTGVLRKPIKCNECDFICCLKCFKTYVTNMETAFKCMSCKKSFEMTFLQEHVSKNYFKNNIIKIEENIMFEQEKKYLVITQRELDVKNKQDELSKIINHHKKELKKSVEKDDDLEYAIQESLIFELENEIKNLSFTYFKKCGNTNCNGMLSDENITNNNYLCTICSSITCKNCELIVLKKPHTCDKNILENIKVLKKETKPCPTCLSRIYKTEGCSQMYCVSCFTVFDWNTGLIDTGKIHNPEYVQSFKYYNRDPLDIQCGRELEHKFWSEPTHNYNKLVKDLKFAGYFCAFYNSRGCISKKVNKFTNETSINRNIRIEYLNGKIDEKKYKQICLENIKFAKKEKELLDIVITFMNCGTEIFFRIFQYWDNETKDLNDHKYQLIQDELSKFTSLCNDEFNKISNVKKDLYRLRLGPNYF